MSERLTELLLNAVRRLPQPEQDEVLGVLLTGALDGTPARSLPSSGPMTIPVIDALHADPAGSAVAATLAARAHPLGRAFQPLGTLDSLGGLAPTEQETALRVLPVRLPVADYERLRTFSREHGFSMAVIIRTLVERFLDGQAQRWTPRRDDPDDDLDQSPAGLA